jgi:hypothetical protein
MDEIRAKELLPAKALGCLDTEENENFLKMMEDDNEFPWQEFGQYQNLVAHMPTLLEFESPNLEVKNKVLKELQSQITVSHLEEEVEEENAPDLTDSVEVMEDEDLIIEEEEIIPSDLDQEIEVDDRKTEVTNGIAIKEPEKPEFDLNALKTPKPKFKREQKEKIQVDAEKKEISRKSTKNYVSKFPRDEKVGKIGSNKLLTVAGIAIVIILVFLLIMYLGLSSEIDDNKKEIEKIKQRIGVALIHEESSPLESKIV